MALQIRKLIDISLELDDSKFQMRTPPGFKKDMQFQMEVIEEHDAEGGAGQIVRGVHMRLHAGSHVDAPEHNVKGGKQIQDLPLETFAGDAVIADLRECVPGKAVTPEILERAVGGVLTPGTTVAISASFNGEGTTPSQSGLLLQKVLVTNVQVADPSTAQTTNTTTPDGNRPGTSPQGSLLVTWQRAGALPFGDGPGRG